MFGNLLNLINNFGWFRMFGRPHWHQQDKPKKGGNSKFSNDRRNNFKGKPKWDLVESYGDGTALWRCRQNGELEVRRVSLSSRITTIDARRYFFDRNNRYKPINMI